MSEPLARWESKSGKHWVNLFSDGVSAWYFTVNGGGSFGKIDTDERAIELTQARVDRGDFLPDNAKTPMRRVK